MGGHGIICAKGFSHAIFSFEQSKQSHCGIKIWLGESDTRPFSASGSRVCAIACFML